MTLINDNREEESLDKVVILSKLNSKDHGMSRHICWVICLDDNLPLTLSIQHQCSEVYHLFRAVNNLVDGVLARSTYIVARPITEVLGVLEGDTVGDFVKGKHLGRASID